MIEERSLLLIAIFYYFVQLERASDGFSVVADYFGRGVFNKVEKSI